jgi:predicted nucleic acid-binding protein
MVQKDAYHVRAREFFREIARDTRLVTSNYVIAETATWLAYHDMRPVASRLKEMVDSAEKTNFLITAWVTPNVHADAWKLFDGWDDQDFSFCDCTSFVLSRSHGVDFVFGFDRHFRTFGLDLKPGPEA